ncbi:MULTISPECIES: fimbrial biogenesis usher protein [Enterobacter]|uniref:fimbrial biogenesis usher protein n=1 Tax=Enterobacter TaxID=547 RepID=UPI0006688DD4|nr:MULTISPECIES: fimbrial biogenesis usher protein [Enterobacter]MBE3465384.1 fimbrial biogenesis usher protein [Enterobacter cloacae complex sp. P20C]MBE3473676.1 fimbrial biogenesis usher protein [Enterobacter cloacae complex sp. P20B]MBE3495534.1 fimbrial biogenesis usher protein [Enterobacter cloacae complex sp. P17RS]MBE3509750.1 fimbrial biogenesis usher protein [Enterobacter cloacae complex sp. I10]MBE3525540.1 fimbrial biogenesis usher protein [Enterobacter cloacae complex sp. I9]
MKFRKYQTRIVNHRLAPLTLAMLGAFASVNADAGYYFNPAFLSSDPAAVADLSRFSNSGQAPGVYRVDVWLNDNFLATRDVTFNVRKNSTPTDDDTGLTPCLSRKSLDAMGVNVDVLPGLKDEKAGNCVDLPAAIPAATTFFDFEHQRLNISIPQAALRNNARGYIPPEQWDEGINALMLNYDFSGSHSHNSGDYGSTTDNYFLGLNSGLNLGPWRLRDFSTWSYNSSGSETYTNWEHIKTYVERAVIPLKSKLTIGENYTTSDVFDSLPFRGVQINSDDNMLPDSMKGFAPTIHGIAKSNAQVTIKQNGYTIYQSYVPPGAFAINDLYPTSSSGDLNVEVKESDGTISSYSVPYSAVPVLQREGTVKYAATAARYRSNSDQQEDTNFVQGTLIWGLPKGFTVYGGTQLTEKYSAFALGTGVNLGNFGAVSADLTSAQSELSDGSSHNGQSIRFLYAKSLNGMGTNFQLLGYRYSTSGFYTLDETTYKQMKGYVGQDDPNDHTDDNQPVWTDYYNLYYTKRGKLQANISQQLGTAGSIFLNGSQQTYWHTDEKNTLIQLGYSGTVAGVTYNLTYNYNKSPGMSESDRIYSLTLSFPLNLWLHPGGDVTKRLNSIYATYGMSTDNDGRVNNTAGINGTLLEDNNLSYSVQQGYQNQHTGASGSISTEYDSAYGNASLGYNYSNNGDYQQINYGLSGGIVAHRNGITLSQPLGDTNVLIAAPGASNVKVEDGPGIHTDWRGYAIVPYASAYHRNRMALNTNSLSDDLDIDEAVTHVVPTQGALVRATFKARSGTRAMIALMHNGRPVPFGAVVTRSDEGGDTIVGDNGEAYLSGLGETGSLTAQWGDTDDKKCVAVYKLSETKQSLVRLKAECR